MVSILSFKLLPDRNSDGVETSLVTGTNFGGKILDKYCLLMLSPSGVTIPRKVKLSEQVLIRLYNWSPGSLPEMSLLFLRFIRLFVTSQMANAPVRTVPWTFSLSCLYYDHEHSFVLSKSLYCIFFPSNSENFCGFLYVFILVLNFLKALGFCQTLFARTLLIFHLFLHLCKVIELSFSDQGQNLHPLIPCWFLKYYLGYLPVHCHHWHEEWPYHHIYVLIPHHLNFSGIFSPYQS